MTRNYDRRQALATCGSDDATEVGTSCSVTPELTEGPYREDGDGWLGVMTFDVQAA